MSTVSIKKHGDHVTELVLDRPDALNAISTEHAEAIATATTEISGDATVRAVVVSSSAERAFCVGADLKERNGFTDVELREQRPVMRSAFAGILDLPMPTIAAVHGFALGGGCELALSCDLIVADETAVLGLPEVTVGLVPGGGGTQLLTRRIGWSRAADVVFTGRQIAAEEAYRLGIADRLVPAGQTRPSALELAAAIADNSPVGVRQAKRAMRLGAGVSMDLALGIEDEAWQTTAFSPDRYEGIAAFNEKRRPRWDPSAPQG
jgi:enoyl-CoA hydratase/carnithine racemase